MDGEPEPEREVTRVPTDADLVSLARELNRLSLREKDVADRSFLQQLIRTRRRS